MLELFSAGDEEKDICERFGCVCVATEHHVGESDIVISLIVAR